MARAAVRKRPLPFQRLQYRFAAHLRDPQRHPAPPGIEPRRLRIYTELFYNNVEGFLANAFPVLRKITGDQRWHAMARDFFARHRSHEPLFHRIAAEFLKYLEHERRAVKDDWPFLLELAHYEWVELALGVAEQQLTPELADPNGDLLDGVPAVSPLAWPLRYRYAVHRIGPDFLPLKLGPQPAHLIVYRNRRDEVKFMETNAVTARLMELMQKKRATGRRLLARIARELKHPQPEQVIAQGVKILQDLRERDIILGTVSRGFRELPVAVRARRTGGARGPAHRRVATRGLGTLRKRRSHD
jgi:hypothetical protein